MENIYVGFLLSLRTSFVSAMAEKKQCCVCPCPCAVALAQTRVRLEGLRVQRSSAFHSLTK